MPTSRLIAPASALWFGAIALLTLWTGTVTAMLLVVLVAGVAVLLLVVPGRYAATSRSLAALTLAMLVLYGPIAISILAHPAEAAVLGNLALLAAYACLGWALAACRASPRPERQAAATLFYRGATIGCGLAFATAFAGFGATAFGPQWWGRLSFAAHPNLVGLVALTGLMASGEVRSGWWRVALIVLFGGVIVATGSRTALVAALFCVAAQASWSLPYLMAAWRRSAFRAAMPIVALLVLVATPYLIWVLVNDLLLLGDPARGIASGFSGRGVLWEQSLALFADNPWFGVGYGAHGDILGIPYAHNMVLVLLADTGVAGLGAFVLMSGLSVAGFWRWRAQPAARTGLVIVLGYWVYGLGEGRALNVGNALSILFVVTLFHGVGLLMVRPATAGAARPVTGTEAAPASVMPPDRRRSAGRPARIGSRSGWPRNARN